MKLTNKRMEWDFICSETGLLHSKNRSLVARELLFLAQSLLILYGKAIDKKKQSFLSSIYLKTKRQYLKETMNYDCTIG